jgi:hypothetical protein
MGIPRRSFLKTSAVLQGAVATSNGCALTSSASEGTKEGLINSCKKALSASPNLPADVCDVLVVGGGMSGMYTAWKLQHDRPQLKIRLLEMADYIGGRLLSVKPPGSDTMVAELGGMRYSEKAHPKVAALVKELEIATYEFNTPTQFYYLRGEHLPASAFDGRKPIPYHLSKGELGPVNASVSHPRSTRN